MGNPTRTHAPKRLSKRVADAAKPEGREYIVWDTDLRGFGLKVLPSGRKSFLLKYRTKAGDKSVDLPVVGVFELEGGKIKVWRDYFEQGTYVRAMQ